MGEKLLAQRQQLRPAPRRQESEEADADETVRQHMQQKTGQELLAGHGHLSLLVGVRVILPAEGHLAVGHVQQPMVGDGDAMGIARQILQDMFRSAERRLSVDDPVLPEQRSKKSTKRLVCADGLQTAGEEKLAAPECRFRPATNLPRKRRASTLTGNKNV